ncbi:MAG: FAD-dependent oxidoreductase [Chloroflexota bacterium]
MDDIQEIYADVLVIGGGAAGLRAAIAASKHGLDVLIVCQSPAGYRNNTAISKATLAASGVWQGPGDSPEVHARDTMEAGRLINDNKLVSVLTYGARQQVDDLLEMGVSLKRRDGELLVAKAPGHAYPRQISAISNQGVRISRAMRQFATKAGVKFIEGILVTRLLRHDGKVVGAIGIDHQGRLFVIGSKATILATGGTGEIYLRTNNAAGSTGDGYALAYEAGAALRDMEFVQFYPTAYGKSGSKLCMYEWYMPAGATIKNSLGEDILVRHDMSVAQATRDVLTRIIMAEINEGRGVENNIIFDLTTMDRGKAGSIYRGVMGKETSISVAPTAHFFMGGVVIDENAMTGIPGLYAAGEVCGGVHGANRLGGNAIGETLVFGAIAGDQAALCAVKRKRVALPRGEVTAEVARLKELASGKRPVNLDSLRTSLKQTMWDKVGIVRDGRKLDGALKEILALREELAGLALVGGQQLAEAVKLGNMLTVAEMVCRAALMRTESRGAHYRVDYPNEDNEQWLKTIRIIRQDEQMFGDVTQASGS